MAWRIDEQVVRGEIDNTVRGRVRGKLWLAGREEPVVLDLKGNCWRDLAGTTLTFSNPAFRQEPGGQGRGPEPASRDLDGFYPDQVGTTGDITASRKVRVPDISMEELMERYEKRESFPWHWSNSLYLEWFSIRNGRVVIESANYELKISPERSWEMTEEEENEQRAANARAIAHFMERVAEAVEAQSIGGEESDPDEDDLSEVERKADEEAARMDLLLDRIQARMDKEDAPEESFERIMDEERERLRKERGEPEPEPLTPEEEARRQEWMDAMNEAAEEVAREAESEKWKGNQREVRRHPLALTAHDLTVRIHDEIEAGGWLSESDPREHPLHEIQIGTMIASAKLAGALTSFEDDFEAEWPPDPIFAGDTLVRLKKAREALNDALAGLDAADEQRLATSEWRSSTRAAILPILAEVKRLIAEVRGSLGG